MQKEIFSRTKSCWTRWIRRSRTVLQSCSHWMSQWNCRLHWIPWVCLVSIQYDTVWYDPKSWRLASLFCCMEPKTIKKTRKRRRKQGKEVKTKPMCSEKAVQVKVHGGSLERGRESMMGTICETTVDSLWWLRCPEIYTTQEASKTCGGQVQASNTCVKLTTALQ